MAVRRRCNCSPEQVFAVLHDGWTYPVWVVGASRMRDVDPGWPAAIEVISAVGLLWRLRKAGPHAAVSEDSAAEKRALHVVAITFFLLAIYVIWEAVKSLIIVPVGIILAVFRSRSCRLSPSPSSGSARRWEAATWSPTPRRRGSAPACH
jgi:hypothetical protein